MTGELVADVAKTLATSASALTLAQLVECYRGQCSSEYVRRAAVACVQLRLATNEGGTFRCNEEDRDTLTKAKKSELHIVLRTRLQDYNPFLIYADFASKEFTSLESAMRVRGLFEIRTAVEMLEKTFRRWGKYADLIEETETGVRIKLDTKKLLSDYVQKLVEALEAELRAKIFTIDMLGPEVFADLDKQGIKLNDIALALRGYESAPKPSASRAMEVFEAYVYALAKAKGVDVQKPKGLMNWVEGLHSQKEKVIPGNLLLLCHGLVGIRNMTHHSPDSETGTEWNISRQAALITTLLVPITIRTVHLYANQRKQEF